MEKANELDLSWRERRELVSKCMGGDLDEAVAKFGDVPVEYLVEDMALPGTPVAFGDGSLLKAIFAWISSPEGQAFIKFIISLFIGMI